jgi:hypothetical protein
LTKENLAEIKNVELLGHNSKLSWTQTKEGLEINLEDKTTGANGYALKIEYLQLIRVNR